MNESIDKTPIYRGLLAEDIDELVRLVFECDLWDLLDEPSLSRIDAAHTQIEDEE